MIPGVKSETPISGEDSNFDSDAGVLERCIFRSLRLVLLLLLMIVLVIESFPSKFEPSTITITSMSTKEEEGHD